MKFALFTLFVGTAVAGDSAVDVLKAGNSSSVDSEGCCRYTYHQKHHKFEGKGYDGTWISTKNACAGANDDCRNNPDCECVKSEGPLPAGKYNIGQMFQYHDYPYSYGALFTSHTCFQSL